MPRIKGLSYQRKKHSKPTLPPNPRPRARQRVENGSCAVEATDVESEEEEEIVPEVSVVFDEVLNDEIRRCAIAHAFVETFKAPPESKWNGRGGTIANIAEVCKIKTGSRGIIRRVLDDVMKCRLDSVQYDPSRKPETGRSTRVIKAGLQENRHTDSRTYYEMWIIPVQGLNSGTVYANRPPGNSPELMPLDSSLNQDVHNAVNQHVIWTHHLKPSDPGFETKFSHATPKQQTSAYLRLLEPSHGPEAGTPLGSRICQDIGKFIPALEAIRDARGVTVPGLGTRNGHRTAANQEGDQRGGRMVKGAPQSAQWVHPDAAVAKRSLARASLDRYQNLQVGA